jgi:hypothetical protein
MLSKRLALLHLLMVSWISLFLIQETLADLTIIAPGVKVVNVLSVGQTSNRTFLLVYHSFLPVLLSPILNF